MIIKENQCSMRFSFRDWSTVKYYTTLQFDMTSRLSIRVSCSNCFRLSDCGEYCVHCNRMICHECLMDHRMELKKNILQNIHRYRGWRRRAENNRRELVQQLENLYVHIECCADELIDQVWKLNNEAKCCPLTNKVFHRLILICIQCSLR